MTTQTHLACHLYPQFASLGPVPPRMPGRADAQVPHDLADGPARYARIAHLYFYADATPADPAFGFVDIEISLQQLGDGRYDVELYCTGDGYQSGTGVAGDTPLTFAFAAGNRIAGTMTWRWPDVMSGRSDPITHRGPIVLADADFEAVDRVIVPPVRATCHVDLD